MSNWFQNGEYAREIAVNDRGLQYGDGLFETIAIRESKPRLWEYHIERLRRGCDVLNIALPDGALLYAGVLDAVVRTNVSGAYAAAKIILTAGDGERGYGRNAAVAPTVLFGAFASAPLAIESYRVGIDVHVCETTLASHSRLAGLKTLNRLEQVMARSELQDLQAFEGLTLDTDQNVICGTMSNVFFVRDRTILTPPIDGCGVSGVMRRHVIETLQAHGTAVSMQHSSLPELITADEVFLTNSQFGVLPIKRIADHDFTRREVTQSVMRLVASNGIQECAL